MPTPLSTGEHTIWELPPLILHPFNERVPPSALLDNSRAALMLAGLIPQDGSGEEELQRRLLVGRYSEIRMLYFLGKDVFRWLDQCVEWAERSGEFDGQEVPPQSFAMLVTASPPEAVREKLIRWGVADSASIFSRAIGLNVLFAQPPAFDTLSEEFLGNYHRYADALYRAFLAATPHTALSPASFRFELYASGEYSKLLESRWSEE
jgi:hypothetical protein